MPSKRPTLVPADIPLRDIRVCAVCGKPVAYFGPNGLVMLASWGRNRQTYVCTAHETGDNPTTERDTSCPPTSS